MRRRWRILVAGLVLGAACGLGLSLQQPLQYTAEATLLLEPGKTSSTATVMDPDEVATQATVIASVGVARRVVEELGLTDTPQQLLDSVSVAVVGETRTVSIAAVRPTPKEAAAVADGFAAQYIVHRSDDASRSALTTGAALQKQLSAVSAQLSTVRRDLGKGPGPARAQLLEAREQSLVARQADLQTQVLLLASSDLPGPGGEVLDPAQPPDVPSQPRPFRGAALGGLVGLVLGTLLAYARDRYDDGVRDEQRLRSAVGEAPVLGRIPLEPAQTPEPVALTFPSSSASEAYRGLTTNIRFLTAAHRSPRKERGELLVVSSSVFGEGKTTVAANIAVTAARVGLRVLLVDADLRDPRIGERFDIEAATGLSHVLAEQRRPEEAVVDVELGFGQLRVMAAGAVPPNPAELLAGPHAGWLWKYLRGLADLVIVDTAPVLGVADTLEIVSHADLMLLVTRHRLSRAHQIQSAVERIHQVGGNVSGVAWCGVPDKDAAVYGRHVLVATP